MQLNEKTERSILILLGGITLNTNLNTLIVRSNGTDVCHHNTNKQFTGDYNPITVMPSPISGIIQ